VLDLGLEEQAGVDADLVSFPLATISSSIGS
jgi:hypothetical protein